MGCHFLLQGILLTQESNPRLPHCRQILYPLSYQSKINILKNGKKKKKGKFDKVMVLEQQTGLKKSGWFTKWHKIPWSQYRDMTSFSGCKVSCNSRKDQFFLIEKPKSLFILCKMSMRRQNLTSLHYPPVISLCDPVQITLPLWAPISSFARIEGWMKGTPKAFLAPVSYDLILFYKMSIAFSSMHLQLMWHSYWNSSVCSNKTISLLVEVSLFPVNPVMGLKTEPRNQHSQCNNYLLLK